MDNRPIGYFDSGIGGLTALKEDLEILQNEDTIYVGDEAHLPYGTKTSKEITFYSRKIVNFLVQQNVKAIVCACNTSSAIALPTIKKELKIPIFGVIEAGSRAAVKTTKNDQIIVLATKATVKSKKYDENLLKLNSNLAVTDFDAQDLVRIVENGDYKSEHVLNQIEKILMPLKEQQADTMILGCTHFPIIEDLIFKATEGRFKMVDAGKSAVKELADYLERENLNHDSLPRQAKHLFYTTAQPNHFDHVANQFLNSKLTIKSEHLGL
ncbi:glutamate racemase [Xylocopilactobacillus apis]|uniref:Glutamate racemase n=1 Tax=Xylocopilactobacillus apis TaxID=2932183 RepID=A0AAU9DM32_9LACO|nr:glutamate racemase [Xylocopilactobacillus apis]BDR56674.1 glutamate racemase [Xylocopilactobacillus apis]